MWEKDGGGVSEEFEEVLQRGFEGGEGAAVGGGYGLFLFVCCWGGLVGREGGGGDL